MSVTDHASLYGLSRPTLSDACVAVHQVHDDAGPTVWNHLMLRANLVGGEADLESLERLLDAMGAADPVTRLCGQALRIRMTVYAVLLDEQSSATGRQ